MQFQLEPDNRGATDETLLDDLRAVATSLNLMSISVSEYAKSGRFHPSTIESRFGGWNAALKRCGLSLRKISVVSEREFLDDVKRVAQMLSADTVTSKQYADHGTFSLKPVPRLFGDWPNVLARIDMKPAAWYERVKSDTDLFENLELVWRSVGRQPRQSDLRKPLSMVGRDVYARRFGSWRNALERFVQFMNSEGAEKTLSDKIEPFRPESQTTGFLADAKGNPSARTANWRLRFLVMRRDSFRCCQCGASPALSSGVVLVIDHIVAWSAGGQTVIDRKSVV